MAGLGSLIRKVVSMTSTADLLMDDGSGKLWDLNAIPYIRDSAIGFVGDWELHAGRRSGTNKAITMWIARQAGEATRQGWKRLRAIKHPRILSYIDGAELKGGGLVMITEKVALLSQQLSTIKMQATWVGWIADCIQQACAFLDRAGIAHGRIGIESIFVTEAGEAKIGYFDYSQAASAGDVRNDCTAIVRSLGRGESGPLIEVAQGMERLAAMGSPEREAVYGLAMRAFSSLPTPFVQHKLLSAVIAAQSTGSPSDNLVGLQLVLRCTTSAAFTSKEGRVTFTEQVEPFLVQSFRRPDRAHRIALLETIPVDLLSTDGILAVYASTVEGTSDGVEDVRERTIRALMQLMPRLPARILNGDLLRHLALFQADPASQIRMSALAALEQVLPMLEDTMRRQTVGPALCQSLKDSQHEIRLKALAMLRSSAKGIAPSELACSVMPVLCTALVDVNAKVREEARQAIMHFTNMLSTFIPPNTKDTADYGNRRKSNATGQGNVLGSVGEMAQRALSSISKKLMDVALPEDNQADVNEEDKMERLDDAFDGLRLINPSSEQPTTPNRQPGSPQDTHPRTSNGPDSSQGQSRTKTVFELGKAGKMRLGATKQALQ